MIVPTAQVQALTDALRGGTDLDTACHFAGLSAAHVLKLLETGKLESERRLNGLAADKTLNEYVKFWEDLKKARADAIVRNVTMVQRAAQDGAWQAAAWWLERTAPEQYAKRTPKPADAPSSKQIPGPQEK